MGGNPSTEWDIVGDGDASVQGFATDISYLPGDTVHFKIDDAFGVPIRLDIYRLGYYAGSGARKMGTVTTVTPTSQQDCLSDPNTGLVDCGNWTDSATWQVPLTAVSGVYIARVVRPDTGGASHIIFVVRNDTSQSDLLFQTSDTAWQAYNQYGGNSLYVGGPGTNPGRAYKVSYNRPLTTRSTSPEDNLFNSEYPMIRFLEANGYNVSYTSGVDTDRRGAELLEHKVFMSVGHDEYLVGDTAQQRRERTRERCEPGVLQRQRELLEDTVGEQHRRIEHGATHPGLLQGNARRREDRPDADLDRHVARRALQPTLRWRPPGKRDDRYDFHGQRHPGGRD